MGMAAALAAGCTTAPAPQPAETRWDVSGRVNLARSKVTVYVDGEQVVQGPLRGQDRHAGPWTLSRPAVFPLRGEYRGLPVAVECGELPYTADPFCEVYIDGQLAQTLLFYQETAGRPPRDD